MRRMFMTIATLPLAAGFLAAQPAIPRLTENYRHYCFDFNWVDRIDPSGKPLSDYRRLSAEDHIRHLVEMKADSLMVFTMSISGYMFYDSKVGERHPTLGYDYLREMVRLGHEKGIAMELYLPTMWADRLIQKNPSWGIRNPDGSLYTASFRGYHPDLNSPAADWYVEVIRELIPAYHGDAFFADGISFLRYGQSEYTVKKFRRDMGRDYPKSLEEDPDWRATLRWEVEQVENYWRKLRDAVKKQDPKVEVTFNGPGPNVQMPGGTGYRQFVPVPPHVNQLTDYVFTEAGSSGEYATWTRGIAYPKPFKVTFLNRYSILDPFDPAEIRARVGRTLAVGGQPYRYDRTSVDGEANAHFTRTWSIIFDEVRQKEEFVVGAEPVKYVAVVSSEPTMLYRGRSDGGSHANDLVGALKMLDALHIQHDVVADWNLKADFLKPYQLVILANASCLSDSQAEAIREYVKQGGSILATAETSLFDETGAVRGEFALSDVFGVRLDEKVTNAIQTADVKRPVYIHPGRDRHAVLDGLPPTELILPGDSTYVRPVSGPPTARLIGDADAYTPTPGQPTDRAAIQVNAYGRGKSMYVCGSLFARSMHHDLTSAGSFRRVHDGVQWVDQLLRNALRLMAPNAPWSAETSTRVWISLNRQLQKNRHVLHIVNWQTDLLGRNVEVSVAAASAPRGEVTQVWPRRLALKNSLRGGQLVFTVPEVGPHVMLILE